MEKIAVKLTKLFPLWIILFSFWSFNEPGLWVKLDFLIIPLLSLVMFSMGLTLKFSNFIKIFKNFKIVLIGVILQFFLMPILGFSLINFIEINEIIGLGVILVGCAPGGTASNVICYLAKGDLALSITLTFCSTLLAVFIMPILFLFYTGAIIDVSVFDMMITIFKIVIIPVFLGLFINTFNIFSIKKINNYLPLVSVLSIVFIISIIIALNSKNIFEYGFVIFIIVIFHNFFGFIISYFFCKRINLNNKIAKTIAIEVGMQNSGLATALAFKYFGYLSALPGALFSIWHNISGVLIASFLKKN